ncbi:MAG: iron reductase, partial [Geodermatophilaceae bacterium]|nr:iron reductase [Geodermatophilaceae bacterium]
MSDSIDTPAALQARVLAGIPRALHSLLRPSPGTKPLGAAAITDPDWLPAQLALGGRMWQTDDQHLLATLWWYSASHSLITPTVATLLVTGRAVSPALDDLVLHQFPDGIVGGAHSTAAVPGDGPAVARALGATLTSVIDAVSAFTKSGIRPLWALATDGLAERLLFFGAALGCVGKARLLAEALCGGIGAPLLAPRYVDVSAPTGRTQTFLRRSSCCLLYR